MTIEGAATRRRAFLKTAGSAATLFSVMGDARAQNACTREQPADRALWISWYDLPGDGRDAYLSWLHETYIPRFLKRPGFLWAAHYAAAKGAGPARQSTRPNTTDPSVPTGNNYILVFGAENANVFGATEHGTLHAGFAEEERRLLAMKIGERENIMVEASRVEGPEAKEYKSGMTLAPCIQLGTFNCAWQREAEMLAWFSQSRMPLMSKLPGCVRTRKLASVSGWAKHAILYELAALESRKRNYLKLEEAHPEAKAWADRMVPNFMHAPGSANIANRIWPAVSG